MKRIFVVLCLFTVACNGGPDHTYTLYRNSAVNDSLRVHVATFNAAESEIYNRDNCGEVGTLLHAKSGPVKLHYWCEKGAFRK